MISGLMILAAIASEPAVEVGKLDHPAIAEASGIVASRRHPGIFWVHNDSGNPPAIFAVRKDGSLVREYAVAAPNVDWEDLAADDSGHLFLGDIGNNGRKLPIRAVYRIDEPDPALAPKGPLPVTLASYYRFPKGEAFDAEGLFLEGGRAVVVAKTSRGGDAALWSVPLDPPSPLLRPATVAKIGALPGFRNPATGADLSRDGTLLAVCSPGEVGVYSRNAEGVWKLLEGVKGPPGQVEAVCWDGRDLVLANEQRGVYRISEAAWRQGSIRRGGGR